MVYTYIHILVHILYIYLCNSGDGSWGKCFLRFCDVVGAKGVVRFLLLCVSHPLVSPHYVYGTISMYIYLVYEMVWDVLRVCGMMP